MRDITTHMAGTTDKETTISAIDNADPNAGGAHHEYLLGFGKGKALIAFQNGQFANQYNAKALEGVNDALAALSQRTKDRESRGVEGQSKH